MTEISSSLAGDLKRLYQHLSRRRRWQLGALIVLMLVGAVAEMATLGAVVPFLALLADPNLVDAYPFLPALFSTLGWHTDNLLLAAAVLFSVIAVVAGGLRLLLTYCNLRLGFGLGTDIGGEIYRRTLYQPYSWHVSKNSSEVLGGIEKVNAVTSGIIVQLLQGGVGLVMSLGIMATLFVIDPHTALIAGVGFTLLYVVATVWLRKPLRANSKLISKNVTARIQALREGLGGIRDILLDGSQPVYVRRFAIFDYGMRRAQAANSFISAAPRFIIESIGIVLIIGLAYWISDRQGGLIGAIPVLGALAVGGQKLLPQMQLAYFSWSTIGGNRHQLRDVLALLERPTAEEFPSTHDPKPTAMGEVKQNVPLIALRNVKFRYGDDTPEVLHSINLEITRGSRIGFIGKTGSGKSTLIDLVMGLLEPTEGVIEIAGDALTAVNRRAWQRRIAHVPQSIYLSDTTLAENIAFGVPPTKIDFEMVRIAARQAQLEEFVESLPHQYHTTVGERGVRLSGGQRQRIGLARALYKHADVLVLDEATSALDNTTEESAMAAIQSLGPELTILIIAHRVATLRYCNVVLELSEGSIMRRGDYESIILHKPIPASKKQ